MWIVRLALARPYTFVVMAMLIALFGVVSILSMPTDIFPKVNIPVVSVIWSYGGLSPTEMQGRITTVAERVMTTTVANIEHIESQSLRGVSVIKVFFQPGTDMASAVAEVTAINQTLLKLFPPGITPPLIIRYNAADVPVVQLSLSSKSLSQQQINDLGNNFIRAQLVTVRGAAVSVPYGGKSPAINIDLDPDALYVRGMSPQEVINSIVAQNLILSAGTAKIGSIEYDVAVNSSPAALTELNNIPLRYANGAMVYLRDVAFVHEGFIPQVNLVRRDGQPSALMPILTSGSASTLAVVDGIRRLVPKIQAGLPPSLDVEFLFDQSVFVRAAIVGVVREGMIAAALTALMILLFLRSWRSTVIVCTSIPLAILTSICVLHVLGQTLNIMTLGGLALAVGILVDDATVEIENDYRHLALGTPLRQAILAAAAEVATPAFVATLSICIVFVPILFLGGVGGFLFAPLAMAVLFAMLASYVLSRTLVPTMALYLLPVEERRMRSPRPLRRSFLSQFGPAFETGFEHFTKGYEALLAWAITHRKFTVISLLAFSIGSLALYPFIGRDFFPSVDTGMLRLHIRCPPGTRIEQTEIAFQRVEDFLREVIPPSELAVVNDNIGVLSPINLARSDSVTVSPADGEILVQLSKGHRPSDEYLRRIRAEFPQRFPELELFTQPADIVSQILNFGLPAPIDIQISGPIGESERNFQIARQIAADLAAVPGAVDVHLQQITAAPRLMVETDRTVAQELGLSESDIASSLSVSLTGSGTATQNFWLNYQNGVSYQVVAQTPQYRVNTMDQLNATPIARQNQSGSQILSNMAEIRRTTTPLSLNHYNVQPVFDVVANVQGSDLGTVSDHINQIITKYTPQISKASSIVVRGQVQSMNQAFFEMGLGIAFAVLLVYFLMVVNFQSWTDPLIILMALPGALAGILWALFATHTTISVPALMGCIMAIGVATSNSILMITFANEQRQPEFGSRDAVAAAMIAGRTRLRPVIMTALAMLIGMLPMSLALGDGGEQNAPLGRAAIGGLAFATIYTLIFVPVMYSLMRRNTPNVIRAQQETQP